MHQSDSVSPQLTAANRQTLLLIARETIAAHLSAREAKYPPVDQALRRRCGAFVTLHTQAHGELRLRGCIGYLDDSYELADTVRRAAEASAFHDGRFSPLTLDELPVIRIEISVLSAFHEIDDLMQVRPGVDGLFIRQGTHSGLLLPQVATTYGWDRVTLLEQTCMKAGLRPSAYKLADTSIQSFTALVFSEEQSPPEESDD